MFLRPRRHLISDSVRFFARRARRAGSRPGRVLDGLEPLEQRRLLATFIVTNTADNVSNPPAGSLRAAIIASNNAAPGPNNIDFDIPASTAPDLDVPVPGFDPVTQDWTITLAGALPPITNTVDIDGYSQGLVGVPYRYPVDFSSQTDSLAVDPSVIGGNYQLSIASYTDQGGVVRSGTTGNIPYDATAAFVQDQLEAIVGTGNVAVTGQTQTSAAGSYSITFQGESTGLAIDVSVTGENLIAGGPDPNPVATLAVTTPGGNPLTTAVNEITSVPNTVQAIDGNNAQIRVIVDGSQTGGATGFVLDTSSAILRGLAIDGFGVAVSVPQAADAGNLIQGNDLGKYLVYPVDPITGQPIPAPNAEYVGGSGNSPSGAGQPVVDIFGTNTTLGGASPQDDNVIAGNGVEGVLLEAGAEGGQVLGNQIGIIGPSDEGLYFPEPNDGPGIVVQSSSNLIGAAGAGNLISTNLGDGVEIAGIPATQNAVAGNYIGVAPGGGYLFGTGDPGNKGDGVDIQDAPDNTIGGTTGGAGNVISDNDMAGVSITGSAAVGNVVSGNRIGVTADGSQALGNGLQGVAVYTSDTQVGPDNVISANQVGVLISGTSVTGVTVVDNLIGTDGTGELDLGNEFQGVLDDGARGVTIQGDAAGSQVISGNNVGIEFEGATATGNLVEGTFIGTDKAGALPLPNAQQGILIDQGSGDNTIGGATATARNLISANHWGIVIDGGPADAANSVLGNRIGTDITGLLPLGNEIDGVQISASSDNTIGGMAAAQGNTIGFNTFDGVDVLSGTGDEILSNDIFSDGQIGINLNGTANDDIAAPVLTLVLSNSVLDSTEIDGTYTAPAAATFLIQFFSNVAADPAGKFEGQTFIGSTTVNTNPTGNRTGTFSVDLPLVAAGSWVTATATYLLPTQPVLGLHVGDTSQFSAAVQAINPFLVTKTADIVTPGTLLDTVHVGTLRYAITYSNLTSQAFAIANPGVSPPPNPITFDIPGAGLQTIQLQAALPMVTEPVSIDGYNQPGSHDNDSTQGIFVTDDQQSDVATILVQLDGSQITGGGVDGLTVAAPSCTIDGLILTGFSGAAIALEPQTGNATTAGSLGDTVWGNFIGVSQFNPRTFDPVTASRNPAANGVGILIDSSNNVIGGAVPQDRNLIQGNIGDGVILYGTQGTRNTLASNFILDNGGDGVLALAADNQIGQATTEGAAGSGNVISGNQGNGVYILGPSARGNVVISDEIGTQIGLAGTINTIRGTQPRPNGGDGVLIENAPVNVIGGQIPAAGNVIAGNTLDGVVIENYVSGTVPAAVPASAGIVVNSPLNAATGNEVQGNDIGFYNGVLQLYAIPNRDGVFISSAGNLIGGDATAARNIIVDNDRNGVTISADQLDSQDNALGAIRNADPTSNLVEGNYIGTQAGNNADGNALDGILIEGAGNNTIGGTSSGAANVISGNNAGVVIQAAAATGNLLAGNVIGLTSAGTAPLGNATDGVAILNAPANIIGGTAGGAANEIAGNGVGVHLSGAGTTGNIVAGNFIGTNAQTSDLLGNSGDGVAIDGGASNNTIGGTTAGAANTIAFNGGSGIGISSGTGDSFLSNSIVSNAQMGIDLSGSANNTQAAPVLTAAVPAVATLVDGTLASVPDTSFLVQIFSNTTADPSGFGQGQTLVGSTVVTTDSGGNAAFNLTLSSALASNLAVSATATNLSTGDTSAFSNDVLAAPVDVQFTTTAYTVGEADGSATISVDRSGNLGATFSVAYATGGGTAAPGVNYTATQGILVFSPGQTIQTFTIPIIASPSPSGDLTVGLSLSNPTGGATLGAPSTAVLTIVDNRPILVAFGASAYTDDESAGSAVITVIRNSPLGSTSVAFATGGGSAVPGVEYTATSGTITFSPGQMSATFTVPLEGVSSPAGQSTVDLSLSDPQGASLGTPSSSTLTLTASAGTLQFDAASATIPETAGGAVITVDRVGGANGTIGVGYTTAALSAIPGVDFTPVSGTLTFAPGVMQQSFTLPVVSNSGNPDDATVSISLGGPTGGAVLGSPGTETVTITKPLIITSEQLSVSGAGITAVTFAFNKPLDPTQARNLANYGTFVITGGRGGSFGPTGSNSTAIASASYDPSNQTVTLVTGAALPLNHLYQIVIDGHANALLNNGLTDANGVLLAGTNGVVGAPYVATVGVGTRLAYSDGSGNVVSLQLRRGGLMELFQAPDGNVEQLKLVGTVPNKSTLTGSVRHGHRAGRTTLFPITGSAGVHIRLHSRAFVTPKVVPAAIADKAVPSAKTVHPAPEAARPFWRRHWRR